MRQPVAPATATHGDDIAETICTLLADMEDLVAAYLFGSVAREQAHALSDVDVALLFSEGEERETIFARTLEIGAALENALRRPVDVLALNQAPPALCFQVLKHGRLLLQRDETERCLFVMRALNRYYDAKPYLDYQDAQLLSRIRKEGLGRGYKGRHDALAEARQLSARFAADTGSSTR